MQPNTSPLQADTGSADTAGRRTITICCYCRKRVYRVRNGEWYHERNSSTSCRPGEGSDRRATPLEIEAGK
jgi:nitrite reductase/ring-hydroxylating ferredoxin subunit